MRIPLVSAIGGCVLFWIAWKLLRMNVSEAGKEQEEKAKQAKNFRQAIILILIADFMMSLDNIIAIAGTAHGEVSLIILGLLISMPLLMVTGGAISLLIDKFKWLIFVGAAVIIFAGTRMIFEDKFIGSKFLVPTAIVLAVSALIGIGVTALFVWTNRRKAKLLAAKTATAATNNPGKNGR
jgi:predicted tellurium resistance membrane protein TerC